MKRRTLLIAASIAGGLLLAALAAVMAPLLLVGTVFDPIASVPSDKDMITHWEKHRGTLDEITEMLRRDPAVNRIGMTWTEPADPERAKLDPERLAQYRELMKRASIISIGRGHRSVYFLYHASGLSVSGFGKGFVRGEASRHAEIVEGDLDAAAAGRNKVFLQRPIADGWWLQRDSS